MAEIKPHEFERFVKNAFERHRIFVLYGPDQGLVAERAAALAAASGVAADDPFALTRLGVADLQGDAGRLIDEVNAIGLFGSRKLVWLRGAQNDKPVIDALQHLVKSPPPDNILIIEAGDLKKGGGLRKIGETAPAVALIANYADDTRSLNALIDAELSAENLRITPQARQRLLEFIGGDRIASRNEIRKLALYCRGEGLIEEHHIDDIIGDASAISTDEAVDAILSGDLPGFEHALQKLTSSKTPVFLVLQSCLRQLQLLDSMKAEMEAGRGSAAQVMATLGRGIHFRRKPVIETALTRWPAEALARECERLQAAILSSRQRPGLEASIAMHTLLATTLQSRPKQPR